MSEKLFAKAAVWQKRMLVAQMLCLLAGVSLLWQTIPRYTPLFQATTWPVVDGTVERFQSHPDKQNWLSAVRVDYKYEVGGKTYHGTQSTFKDMPSSQGDGGDLTQYFKSGYKDALEHEYPRGSHHKISYDRKDPARSLINIKFNPFDLLTGGGFFAGVFFFLYGILMFYYGVNERVRRTCGPSTGHDA